MRYKLLAKRRPRSTILLQWNPSFGELLDQVHFSCRSLWWNTTKYDVILVNCVSLRTSWMTLVSMQ